MKDLVIGGKKFTNRFFLGTGKFASGDLLKQALAASGTELVTTALTRVHEGDAENDDILKVIDRTKVEVMLNTSGARNASEAVRIAKLGKAAGYNWIKIEVHPDARYLLPDPVETLAAVEECAKMGMVVLPYINADPVLARRCEEAGAAAVMPLGAPIGSNRGIRTRDMIEIIVEQSHVPVVVDAGIGLPSHAAEPSWRTPRWRRPTIPLRWPRPSTLRFRRRSSPSRRARRRHVRRRARRVRWTSSNKSQTRGKKQEVWNVSSFEVQ